MQVLLGEFSGRSEAKRYLTKNGWGRMWASYGPQWEYDDEPWGFDNGAYACFRAGTEFDDEKFLRRMNRARQLQRHPPIVAVLPDVVGSGLATLAISEKWLASGKLQPDWPWFLAVQDGTCPERVRRLLCSPRVSGLFLGGTDEFKRTARLWCEMSHRNQKAFHYGRCNREAWLREAIDIGADSIDTTRPVRALTSGERSKFLLFEQIATGKCPQGGLFT